MKNDVSYSQEFMTIISITQSIILHEINKKR